MQFPFDGLSLPKPNWLRAARFASGYEHKAQSFFLVANLLTRRIVGVFFRLLPENTGKRSFR